jgi:hypothetical protein
VKTKMPTRCVPFLFFLCTAGKNTPQNKQNQHISPGNRAKARPEDAHALPPVPLLLPRPPLHPLPPPR